MNVLRKNFFIFGCNSNSLINIIIIYLHEYLKYISIIALDTEME